MKESLSEHETEINKNEKYSKTVERVAEALLPTEYGNFRIIGYRSLNSNEEFVVLARGEFQPNKSALARIHSQCLTGDVFGSIKCDCGQQLQAAMKLIADEGCGTWLTFFRRSRASGGASNTGVRRLQQGRTATHSMAGKKSVYKSVPFFWTRQFDTSLLNAGHAAKRDEIIFQGNISDGNFLAFYVEDNRVSAG